MARSLSPLRDDGPVTLADDTDLFYVSVQICVAGPGCLDYSPTGGIAPNIIVSTLDRLLPQ